MSGAPGFRLGALLVMGLVGSSTAQAQSGPEEIKVLVVFTEDAKTKIENDQLWHPTFNNNDPDEFAQDVIDGMNEVLENSGLDDDVEWVLTGTDDIDYDENGSGAAGNNTESSNNKNETAGEIADHGDEIMIGNETVDDAMDYAEADILIVVADWQDPGGDPNENDCCGAVSGILDDVNGDVDNNVIVIDEVDTRGRVAAHEAAHIGGVIHENDTANTPAEDSAVAIKIEGTGGDPDVASIGASECDPADCEESDTYSSPDIDFTDSKGNTHTMGDEDHDAVSTLKKTLPKIADYAEDRPVGPPTTATTRQAWYYGCVAGLQSFHATWDSTNLRYGDYFEVEYGPGVGWTPWYEGGSSCVPINTVLTEIFFRVRVVNKHGQASTWATFGAFGSCGGVPL